MGSNVIFPAVSTGVKKIAQFTKADAAASSWTVSASLSLSILKKYWLRTYLPITSGTEELYMLLNNDATATNYYAQTITIVDAIVSAAKVNAPFICRRQYAASRNYIDILLSFSSAGYAVAKSNSVEESNTATEISISSIGYKKTNAAVASVTQIDFKTTGATTIMTGAWCEIYEITQV